MLDFLLKNWLVIVAALALAAYMVYLAVNRRWDKLRKLAYKMIRQAEDVIVGTKKGQERFNLVLDQLYGIIPVWLRLFIPRSLLKEKLQQWFDLIKDGLDDGKINKSV